MRNRSSCFSSSVWPKDEAEAAGCSEGLMLPVLVLFVPRFLPLAMVVVVVEVSATQKIQRVMTNAGRKRIGIHDIQWH